MATSVTGALGFDVASLANVVERRDDAAVGNVGDQRWGLDTAGRADVVERFDVARRADVVEPLDAGAKRGGVVAAGGLDVGALASRGVAGRPSGRRRRAARRGEARGLDVQAVASRGVGGRPGRRRRAARCGGASLLYARPRNAKKKISNFVRSRVRVDHSPCFGTPITKMAPLLGRTETRGFSTDNRYSRYRRRLGRYVSLNEPSLLSNT